MTSLGYTLLIAAFTLAALVQLVFVFLLRHRKAIPGTLSPKAEPVSVIICAKNEAANLQQFLPAILTQEYPGNQFEVIVVNDGSTDHSAQILTTLSAQYPQLKVVTIPAGTAKNLPGKKYALSQGIAAAQYEQLLLTDADCRPSSCQWLQLMTASRKDITLGYGGYAKLPGLLNAFIRWETVHTCMQYASYAAMGLPYMGVGRNLAYKKTIVKEAVNDPAFLRIYRETPSGDDDLLICKVANRRNTAICLDREAHTISLPKTTWQDWWKQKTRHTSTGKYYPATIKKLLGLYALSHCLYWFSGIVILLLTSCQCQLPVAGNILAALFLSRLMLYWLNASGWYSQLNEKKLLLFYPLGDLGWALYNVFLSPYILWKNRKDWK